MLDTNTSESSAVTLRGPMLAAHRQFRKTIATYTGEQKGRSLEASLTLRTNPDSLVTLQALHRHQAAMSAMREVEEKFGKPSAVPAYDAGALTYLRGQQAMMELEHNSAIVIALSVANQLLQEEPGTPAHREQTRRAAKEMGRVDAYAQALNIFHSCFLDVMEAAEAL